MIYVVELDTFQVSDHYNNIDDLVNAWHYSNLKEKYEDIKGEVITRCKIQYRDCIIVNMYVYELITILGGHYQGEDGKIISNVKSYALKEKLKMLLNSSI